MAQPDEAAGRDELPSPAEEAFNKMAERLMNEEAEPEDDEEDEADPDNSAEEGEELSIEEEETEEQFPAPNSLTDEEKAAYAALPDESKAFVSRRIGELERGFHAKAQEASSARETAQMESLRYAEQLQGEAVAKLQEFATLLTPQVPDARLARTDPGAYAYALSLYHETNAQREAAQREAQTREQQRKAYEAEIERREQATFRVQLEAELPELFDQASGKAFAQTLNDAAQALGYDSDALSRATVDELKALKFAAQWKAKADKYDKAVSKKAESNGKSPPPVAKPGTPKGAGTRKAQATGKAWELAKNARPGADRDAALAIWAERAGFI